MSKTSKEKRQPLTWTEAEMHFLDMSSRLIELAFEQRSTFMNNRRRVRMTEIQQNAV